jgi:nucleoside-diphosphate-sugar epimerase
MVGRESQEGKDVDWTNRRVLVTGGASFIGSHLVDALIARGASPSVVDDLSSGHYEYLEPYVRDGRVEFLHGSLLEQSTVRRAVEGADVVFHLAADHGGRGYVDLHQAACATNLALDGMLLKAALDAGVERVVYASSGCVYPNFLQGNPDEILYLTEEMVGPPFDADNMYGWAKLMAELTLKAYSEEWGMKTASCRYFTVYGERGKEDHAVIAMIARAFVEQIRNWTYVGDIVEGTIRCAENIEDGTAVNLGTMERTRVLDAVNEVLRYTGHEADIELHPEMPTGPMNRVADNTLAKKLLLGWEPEMTFVNGLHRTIDWYLSTKDRTEVAAKLEAALTER